MAPFWRPMYNTLDVYYFILFYAVCLKYQPLAYKIVTFDV
jgi:hypothetical protein